ncbi:putative O-glycosylation ligase, exosortase A system-associated [Massilia sp. Root335]|jgi:probable O-glycosylation ligase (exosortase A-associated)|uniref:putative O-glycosylation ligase, exosortase A system-associated n=1 Tax=Massilia sp. Root335 TaxID=1736517 RepID=UPI0009E8F0B6|nr:putative O-glycosylation ligase, exosortase A system-associated [Massilia sp. Root335]
MQSLFLSAVFAVLMFAGFSAAFAAALGFVWVDIVRPQQLAYSIINDQPLSFIAAVATLGLFLLRDKKSPPKFGPILLLIVLFCLWVTFTTLISDFPTQAWGKWDWASKVLIFAVLIPYIFRSRIQIEAFILVFVFSASTILFSAGLKTILGGGGYGTLAVMGTGNTGLSESSTLAVVCVMLIPLVMFLMRHTVIFPRNLLTRGLFLAIIVMALAAVVGTTARTGIIAVAVMCLLSMLQSKKKLWWIAGLALAAVVILNLDLSATRWGNRMSTIETYNADSSAMGRIKVWQWTIEFVGKHPLGGGFDAYLHNRILGVTSDGETQYLPEGQVGGKAFHSIYFEVLGEQGIVGFSMYALMVGLAMFKLIRLKRAWKNDAGMAWISGLANALMTSIVVFLAGGSFVGIAYQPYIFYMLSLTVAIDQYARRVVQDQLKVKGRAIP